MTVERDLETLAAQEDALVFPSFDEAEAFELGKLLRRIALERRLPVVVDIRLWDRPLFYAALPGSTAANALWARRKIETVRLYQKCTYRMFLEQGGQSRVLPADHGLSPQEHAIAGGAFPIRVSGFGAIGAVAVSGLPQRDDHRLVAEVLAAHLGLDDGVPMLPA